MPNGTRKKTTKGEKQSRPSEGKSEQSKQAWGWRLISPASAETIRKLAIDTFIVTAIVVALAVALKATMNTVVRFEPISVPKELADRGYTGEVLAQRIVDELLNIQNKGATSMAAGNFSASSLERTLPKVETPVGAFSLAPIVSYLRELFGISDTRIMGEVVTTVRPQSPPAVGSTPQPLKYSLSLRIVDRGNVGLQANATEDIDKLVRIAALKLIEKLHPYILASYLNGGAKAPYEEIFLASYFQEEKKERPEEVLRLLRLCLNNETPGDDARALNLLGLILYGEGKYDEAITEFESIINRFPDFPLAYYNLSMALSAKKGRYEDAYRVAIKGTRLDNHPRTLATGFNNAAVALFKLNKDQLSVKYAGFGIANNPLDELVHYNHGKALLRLGRYNEAADSFRRTSELKPNDAWSRVYWGEALARRLLKPMRSEQPPALITTESSSLKYAAQILESLARLFQFDWLTGSEKDPTLRQVIQQLEIASDMALTHGLLQNQLGEVYELLGHLEKAIEAYERAIKVDVDRWVTLVGKVKRLREQPVPF